MNFGIKNSPNCNLKVSKYFDTFLFYLKSLFCLSVQERK